MTPDAQTGAHGSAEQPPQAPAPASGPGLKDPNAGAGRPAEQPPAELWVCGNHVDAALDLQRSAEPSPPSADLP